MARLTAAQADQARHKQIARLLLQFAEETYKNQKKEKQVFMVCVRNKRTALGYQQGALPNGLVDSAQFHEKKADFNNFSMIHLKYFQVLTIFTKIPFNKTFVCPLTFSERMFFRHWNAFSCHTAVLINEASSIFTIGVDRKVTKI